MLEESSLPSTSYLSSSPVSSPALSLSARHGSLSRAHRLLIDSGDLDLDVRPPSVSCAVVAQGSGVPGTGSSLHATATRAFLLGARQVIMGSLSAVLTVQQHVWRPTAAAGRFVALRVALGTRCGAGTLGSALARTLRFPFLRRRTLKRLLHRHDLPSISSVHNERITLRSCSDCLFKLEYVTSSKVILKDLRDCQVMLVGCSQLELVIRDCDNLHIKELGSGAMGDLLRRNCRHFTHEVVCLRCACQPLQPSPSAGRKWMPTLALDASACL